jgi:hypothetical protein
MGKIMGVELNISQIKKCPICGEQKNTSTDYWKGQYLCISCQKEKQKNYWNSRTPKKRLEQHLKYKYDLTMNELIDTLKNQNGKCAICADILPDLLVYNNRRGKYAIDHNHETGKFRGILCLPCNSMLGMSKDSAVLLRKAASYLEDKGSYHGLHETKKEFSDG